MRCIHETFRLIDGWGGAGWRRELSQTATTKYTHARTHARTHAPS